MEENRPAKIAKVEEKTQETEMADHQKTEDHHYHHHSSQETEENTKISPEEAKEKKNISPPKMVEQQITEIDFDEINHEFLAEKSSIKETVADPKMADNQTTEIDYDELKAIYHEFFAEESSIEESGEEIDEEESDKEIDKESEGSIEESNEEINKESEGSIEESDEEIYEEPEEESGWDNISVGEFLQNIGATVVESYIKALESGNIDELGHELDEFRDQGFAGSLIILSVYDKHDWYTKEKLVLVLKILKEHMIESKFSDLADLIIKYSPEDFNLVKALQLATWYVMCIFSLANEVEPVKFITKAVIYPILSEEYDDGVILPTVSSFLSSEYLTLHRVAFVVITVLAKLIKKRNSVKLLLMIHKAGIVDAVGNMDFTTLSEGDRELATDCSVALGEMPKLESKDKQAAGKEPVLKKQVQ